MFFLKHSRMMVLSCSGVKFLQYSPHVAVKDCWCSSLIIPLDLNGFFKTGCMTFWVVPRSSSSYSWSWFEFDLLRLHSWSSSAASWSLKWGPLKGECTELALWEADIAPGNAPAPALRLPMQVHWYRSTPIKLGMTTSPFYAIASGMVLKLAFSLSCFCFKWRKSLAEFKVSFEGLLYFSNELAFWCKVVLSVAPLAAAAFPNGLSSFFMLAFTDSGCLWLYL